MMPLFERMRFLRSVPLFEQLSSADLRSVASIVEQVDCQDRHCVIRQGDAGDEMYVVVKGEVSIRTGERVLATRTARQFFGELSVLDSAPRSADAFCIGDVRLLRLRGADLEELMASRPAIAREVMLVVVRRLREASAQLGA